MSLNRRLEEIISPRDFIDYIKEYPVEQGALSSLFPTRVVEGLEYDYVLGAYQRPATAQFYSFDTPTELDQRRGFQSGSGDLALIKDKMKLDEKEIYILEHPRTDTEANLAIRKVYRDVDIIRENIENTIEVLRAQALTTGKVEIHENGLDTVIDFGVPEEHKGNLTWSDSKHDVLEDLFDITEQMSSDTGFPVSHILTSRKVLYTLCKNETIRTAIRGTEKERYLTPTELNSELAKMGFPTISVDERRYEVLTQRDGKLKRELTRYIPETSVLFLPDGKLGETIRGDTPEARGLRSSNICDVQPGDVTITYYDEVDPVAKYVKGSATAMVNFPYADQVYIGTFE